MASIPGNTRTDKKANLCVALETVWETLERVWGGALETAQEKREL